MITCWEEILALGGWRALNYLGLEVYGLWSLGFRASEGFGLRV